ncbi:MAG: hypothetical protein MUE46_04125 [Xanthomonadales bacterium]|jgi:hypothetical protein|nr:hypothetical protein [Xanthomonadales bacterium]
MLTRTIFVAALLQATVVHAKGSILFDDVTCAARKGLAHADVNLGVTSRAALTDVQARCDRSAGYFAEQMRSGNPAAIVHAINSGMKVDIPREALLHHLNALSESSDPVDIYVLSVFVVAGAGRVLEGMDSPSAMFFGSVASEVLLDRAIGLGLDISGTSDVAVLNCSLGVCEDLESRLSDGNSVRTRDAALYETVASEMQSRIDSGQPMFVAAK